MHMLSNILDNRPFMRRGEPEFLVQILNKLPANPTVLEIGTFRGLSAVLMAKQRKDAFIITIDPHIGIESSSLTSTEETARANFRRFKVESRIHHEKISSQEFKLTKEIDMLFIDGEHSFAGVSHDYCKFQGYVKKGGYIVFHDYEFKDIKNFCDSLEVNALIYRAIFAFKQ